MRVDIVYRSAGTHIMEQTGSRIYIERCAYHDKHIGLAHKLYGRLYIGHGFLEKHDMRPHTVSVDYGIGSSVERPWMKSVHLCLIINGTHFHKLAMKMKHILAAGTLMEVINILSNDVYIVPLFEINQPEMTGIGLGFQQIVAPLIVKFMYERRICGIAVGTCHLHHGIFLPKAACITERGDSTLGAHAGTGGYDKFRFHDI